MKPDKKRKKSEKDATAAAASAQQTPPSPSPPASGAPSQRLVWFERARAAQEYQLALKQADAKALSLFDAVAHQIQEQFQISLVLYYVVVIVALLILVISLLVLVFSPANPYLQTFSLIGMPAGLLALLVALLRNPMRQQRQLLDSALKLMVIFLTFVRRVQQSDLLLQFVIYEDDPLELQKIYALVQDFQNSVDQTLDEVGRILPR